MISPKLLRPTAREEREAYESVRARSGGVCEGCGVRKATDTHHRLYRSRGGLTTVDNLIALCGSVNGLPGGNHSGCHGVAHTLIGEHLGWSVHSRNDPAEIPIFHKHDTTWTLRGEPIPASFAVEILTGLGQMREGLGVS